jgi:hypothetical protein
MDCDGLQNSCWSKFAVGAKYCQTAFSTCAVANHMTLHVFFFFKDLIFCPTLRFPNVCARDPLHNHCSFFGNRQSAGFVQQR